MRRFMILMAVVAFLGVAGTAEADIVINEAMVDPDAVSDTTGEWVELFNSGDTAVDIDGWTIKDADSNSHLIDNGGSLLIPAYGFLVLGRSAVFAENGGYVPDYVYSCFQLSNTIDEIILENSSVEIDRVDYSGSWPVNAGRSLAYTGSGDNNVLDNWFCTPQTSEYIFGAGDYASPGQPNVIPEPSSLLLWLSGLLFLSFRKQKH